jgi:hypothetical protein
MRGSKHQLITKKTHAPFSYISNKYFLPLAVKKKHVMYNMRNISVGILSKRGEKVDVEHFISKTYKFNALRLN